MITQTFEIKVAILGYVSVGKTTVLNALLQDKFSEVSMRRTTAGINFFRIAAPASPQDPPNNGTPKRKAVDAAATLKQPAAVGDSGGDDINGNNNNTVKVEESGGKYANKGNNNSDRTLDEMDWSSVMADEPRLAKSTLEEITADNQKLRAMKNTIQEKTFDIQLNEPLCKMRRDTTLVLMDVPGLNEADSRNVYRKYVETTWDTLDCVIVVMDAEKGVNTDEQVELLRFVKKNLDESKQIPVIVLCNKVDDPDDEELMMLVNEMRAKVEQIYQVCNRTDALQALLKNVTDEVAKRPNYYPFLKMFPVFLPLSAGNAFAYRSASCCCTMEKFQQLDIKIIDKLGREEVGTFKWKKLSLEDKYKTAFDAVSDSKEYMERLEATNFDKLLAVLGYCVGGDDVQCQLLAKQVEISLRKLKLLGDTPVAVELRGVYDKCKVLKRDATTMLKVKFWNLFRIASQKEYETCLQVMDLSILHGLMDELIAYSDFVSQVGWVDQLQKIDEKMEELVRMQITAILEKEQDWKIDNSDLGRFKCNYVWKGDAWYRGNERHSSNKLWGSEAIPWAWERDGNGWRNVYSGAQKERNGNPVSGTIDGGACWKTLTYHDWVTILSSVLLVSHNKHFYERLSQEKMLLESRLQRHMHYANCLTSDGKTEGEKNALANIPIFMQGGFVDGQFVPRDPLMYRTAVQVVNPKLVSDPAHWGHLVWKFCNYMDKRHK